MTSAIVIAWFWTGLAATPATAEADVLISRPDFVAYVPH